MGHSLSRFVPENAAMWGVVNQSPIVRQSMDLSWDLYQDETLRVALNALERAKTIAIEGILVLFVSVFCRVDKAHLYPIPNLIQ